jgi:hypothetical protein
MADSDWAKLDIDPEKIPELQAKLREDIFLACLALEVEGDCLMKAAQGLREGLLANLDRRMFWDPRRKETVEEWVRSVCMKFVDDLREHNANLRKFRELDPAGTPTQ